MFKCTMETSSGEEDICKALPLAEVIATSNFLHVSGVFLYTLV